MKVKPADVISFIHQRPRLQRTSDLTRIKNVLEELGNPQNTIKSIHITGTNGKGSTSYYLNNLLIAGGNKVGLFTSPFVIEFNERIQLNSRNISNTDLAYYVNRIVLIEESHGPDFFLTEFEYLVVIAFQYFADQKVDYAIIETGIGAKRDKTNVIKPILTMITSIGMDHADLIGPTIKDITIEKAGIIKPETLLILGDVPKTSLELLQQVASKNHAPIFFLNNDFLIADSKSSFSYRFLDYDLSFKTRPLVEEYDVAMSVTGYLLLEKDRLITSAKIEQVIDTTTIPGRYQELQKSPLIMIDGGHNPQAFGYYRQYLEKARPEDGRIFYLMAMMKDKELHQIISQLPKETTFLTTIDYFRAASHEDFENAGLSDYTFEKDFKKAFGQIMKQVKQNDVVAIGGSYYFVTDFLNFFAEGDAHENR